jgi:hypothetical protein
LWDTATGREVRRIPELASNAAAVAPDGKHVCDHPERDGSLALRDMATGRVVRRFQGYPRLLSAAAFSPDGKFLAAAFYSDSRAVVLWEVATGAKLGECPGGNAAFTALAFSPDSKVLASGSQDGTVRLWEAVTGRERHCFRGHLGGVSALGFSPDGRRLVSGGEDTLGMVWDVLGRDSTGPGDLAARDVPALWDDLANADGERSYRAMCRLAAAPQPVALLREHLRPAGAASSERLARLVADLDSTRFEARQQAAQELEALEEVAEPALRRAREAGPSLEVRRRAGQILDKLPLAASPERLRQLRAIEVLEALGTADARRLLEELSGGAPEALRTREARASLERLARRLPAP